MRDEMLPKLLVIFIAVNLKLIICEPMAQLDLPPLNVVITAKPEVTLNSYTENKDSDRSEGLSSDYDRDRSQRFGPPYIDELSRFINRSSSYGFEDINYNRQKPFRDEDKYYANRNRDDVNGNLDFDRSRNNGRDGYQYQNVQNLSFYWHFSLLTHCYFSQIITTTTDIMMIETSTITTMTIDPTIATD